MRSYAQTFENLDLDYTDRPVLVSGASTGIGRKTTELLAAAGCLVYAGARTESDLRALGTLANVQPLRLDVTSATDIAAAVDVVTRAGRGLYGLVNNAGVVTLGPVLESNLAELDLMLAVNVRGTYHLTRALAPLIVPARGRVVMLSSVAGILADPNVSAYSMSKHAIEAFTDCLAAEMQPLGVQACVIEPGTFKSEICANAVRRAGPNPLLPDFSHCEEPDEVATAIARALFERRSKRRYLVVSSEAQAQETISKQIGQLVELNEGHRYTYDRGALIAMLDAALASARPRVT